MKIDHVALYTTDLERERTFYETYFNARANAKYHNPKTGLQTYFLTFEGGARLELMTRPDVAACSPQAYAAGWAHLSFRVNGKQAVDKLTARLSADGYAVISAPRTTGDGYYESCVADPDGNRIEITE